MKRRRKKTNSKQFTRFRIKRLIFSILGSQNDGIGIEEDDLSSISSVKSTNDLWDTIDTNQHGKKNFAELVNKVAGDSHRKALKNRDRDGVISPGDYENHEEIQVIVER